MKKNSLYAAVALFLSFTFVMGVPLVKTSAPFSFTSAIDNKKPSPSGFMAQSQKHRVIFSWTISANSPSGSLSILTITGKKLHSMPLAGKSGSIAWEHKKLNPPMGIYIAEIQFGDYKQKTRFTIIK